MKKPIPAKSLAVRLGSDASSIVVSLAKINGSTPRAAAELYITKMEALLAGKISLDELAAAVAACVAPRKGGRK